MKRLAGLMVLMALTTPAHAGSYSFVFGGHRIHVEASRHCRSLSCVSWTDLTKKRDRDEAVTANADPVPAATPAPAAVVAPVTAPPTPAPVAVQQAPPAPQPQIAAAPVQAPPPPAPVQAAPTATAVLKPVETRAVVVTPPPAPQAAPVQPDAKVEPKPGVGFDVKPEAKAEPKPSVGFDLRPDAKFEPKVESKVEPKVEKKAEIKPEAKPDTTASVTKAPAEKPQADKPTVVAKPAPSKTSLESEGEGIEAPIGDWQTEGRKGLVRIEPCGTALCGYMINTSTNTKGETVLINMRPKSSEKSSGWSGSIYSRASGNTYYATMTIKRPNTLRVEACVVGRYFCSGNDWTRIATRLDPTIATREASAEPR